MRRLILVLSVTMMALVALSDGVASGKEPGASGFTLGNAPGSKGATLFTNGTIYIDADRKAQNLLVRDGKVAGWNVPPEKFPVAVTVDLKGAAAYPGFIDRPCSPDGVRDHVSIGSGPRGLYRC